METLKQRVRRSESLTPKEWREYKRIVEKALIEKSTSKTEIAQKLGVSNVTLDAVYAKGSGKPGTIAIIREWLNLTTAA